MEKTKKSIFETPLLSTKIKSANTKLFPEGALGYFIGPTLALLANSILSGNFNRYMSDVLGITTWASWFFNWLPLISVLFVVLGNILVGRLMDHSRTKAGKARPIILLSIPVSIIALLFLFVFTPFPESMEAGANNVALLVLIAIGYNLWFAVAYPLYFTPHSALVNLSTRSSKDRSLLATISNATALAAMGLCSMVLPFFLSLLFVNQVDPAKIAELQGYVMNAAVDGQAEILVGGVVVAIATVNADGAITQIVNKLTNVAYLDSQKSFNNWKIFVIALIIITFLGAVIEYFFTRERVTEESLNNGSLEEKKAAPISRQAKACLKDKFWWIILIFFFLYQLGGMLKNVSQTYYCYTMFADEKGQYSVAYGGALQGTLSIIGAIPTAIGMVIAWPLSNKIGKGKAILFGAILSTIGGAIGFIAPNDFMVVTASFVVKALGSTPAMYLSLALLADILDHQEAIHGIRTDGLTMTVYGAIMAGMTGIATTVLNVALTGTGYDAAAGHISSPEIQTAMLWIFIGGETVCYALIALIFVFMGVEKFSGLDHKAIIVDQKAAAEAEGREFVDPATRLAEEEAEADRVAEQAKLDELKKKCEKKGLDYDAEVAKIEKAEAEKQAKADAKKAESDAKKAEKEKEKQAKYDALSPEEKAKLEEKAKAKQEKLDKRNAAVLVEFNKIREANGKSAL